MRIMSWDGRLATRRPAFSLAELMIALAILGFGLLVIGAALPVGLNYTRDSVDTATGAAMLDAVIESVQQRVYLQRGPIYTPADTSVVPPRPEQWRMATIFEPRQGDPAAPDLSQFVETAGTDREPLIKVRPLLYSNFFLDRGRFAAPFELFYPHPDAVWRRPEEACARWQVLNVPGLATGFDATHFLDPAVPIVAGPGSWVRPCLSWYDLVYPPIDFVKQRTTNGFLSQLGNTPPYDRALEENEDRVESAAERRRAAKERRFFAVPFYRRFSYAPGSDPSLYELVVVAVRSPGVGYRFPIQDATFITGGGGPAAYDQHDSLVPIPWLLTFDELPKAPPIGDPVANFDRTWNPSLPTPSTLSFTCYAADSGLLPEGSILIPAVNETLPVGASPTRGGIGFAPHAPESLPIYKVVKRPDATTVIVEFNGFYPYAAPDAAGNQQAQLWPVWVIPPAFKDLDGGRPVFESRSPVVGVSRRVSSLREVRE